MRGDAIPDNNWFMIKHCIFFYWSDEVQGSYFMEKEGLFRVLDFLHQQELEVCVLVRDRH